MSLTFPSSEKDKNPSSEVDYRWNRVRNGSTTYPSMTDQLDLLWHAIDADADLKVKFAGFYNAIKAVKDANPKPN